MELLAKDALALKHFVHVNSVGIRSGSTGRLCDFTNAIKPGWLFMRLLGIRKATLNVQA